MIHDERGSRSSLPLPAGPAPSCSSCEEKDAPFCGRSSPRNWLLAGDLKVEAARVSDRVFEEEEVRRERRRERQGAQTGTSIGNNLGLCGGGLRSRCAA